MAEGSCDVWHCLALLGLALFLMFYELACFIGLLSLSIGVGAGLKLIVKYLLSIEIHVSVETFVTWYCLACTTEFHLRLYKKCVYPKIREKIRSHPNVLLGLPRIVYFVLYCLAIFGIFYEYEAYSYAYQCKSDCESEPLRDRLNENKRNFNTSNNSPPPLHLNSSNASRNLSSNGSMETHNHKIVAVVKRSLLENGEHPLGDLSSTEEVEKEKVATALFLMFMSYLIYATGQIICGYLLRINRGIPATAFACPTIIYATTCMMVLQVILTVFYSLPILMFLGACYCFYVDSDTTYMFTLCVATSVSMAASHLELESLFPREAALSPFFWFESLQRARVNIVFILLFPVAHYFFQRSTNRNYPLNARDSEFIRFCFWFFVCLMHTVKTLYLTTADPQPRIIIAQNNPENHEPLVPDDDGDDVPDQLMRNPDYPRPSAQENRNPVQNFISGNNNNPDENGTGKNVEESPSQTNSREKLKEGVSITKNDPNPDQNLPHKKKTNFENDSDIYSTVSETGATVAASSSSSSNTIKTTDAHSSVSKNNNSNNINNIIMTTSQPVDKSEIENVFKELETQKDHNEEDVLKNDITATTKKKSESEIKIIKT